MKVRVLYKQNSVNVIYPAPKSRLPNESEDVWLKRVFNKATPEGVEYEDMDSSQLPPTREDRDAWEKKPGGGVQVNQQKAKQIKDEKKKKKLIQEEILKLAEKSLKDQGLI